APDAAPAPPAHARRVRARRLRRLEPHRCDRARRPLRARARRRQAGRPPDRLPAVHDPLGAADLDRLAAAGLPLRPDRPPSAAPAPRPPRRMNLLVAERGGPSRPLAPLRASGRPQLPKLSPPHVADVRFSRARLPAGPAVVMTKPSSGPSSPAITIYLVLHAGLGYELEFETSRTPTKAVLATISRIAHALRFDGGAAAARYPVEYTLDGTDSTHPGAEGSSLQLAFSRLRFADGKWRLDAQVTNTSAGLLTLSFRLLLVRYAD